MSTATQAPKRNTTWVVTLKTGDNTWSNIMVEADTHLGAARMAKRLLGDFPVTKIW
jgi:hypothetical protein